MISIEPRRLQADLQMDEPADTATHDRLARSCQAARARVGAALRPVAAAGDLDEGSPHAESIEHCLSLYARGDWFLANGQPELASTMFREGGRFLDILIKNLTANLGERVEPVFVGGNWLDLNILTPGQYMRGGAIIGALGGARRAGNVF